MLVRVALLLAILGILIVPICSGCATVGLDENKVSYTDNCSVSENSAVTVLNSGINGDVNVESWGKDYVEVTWTKSTSWGKSELDNVEVKVTPGSDRLDIVARELSKDAKVSVNYDIKLPKNALLSNVTTADGNIKITGTSGDTAAIVRFGSISVQNTSGYLDLTAEKGKIRLEGTTGGANLTTSEDAIEVTNADGDITATNSKGDITANDCKGNLTLQNSIGGIHVSNLQGCVLVAKTSRGPVTVKGATAVEVVETSDADVRAEFSSVGANGTTITVKTGSVSLYLPTSINADLELRTLSGDIATHSFGGMTTSADSSGGYLKGTVGAGGNRIYVETSKGSIDLFRSETA